MAASSKEAAMKRYLVIVEWSNDPDGFDGDSDEIRVMAKTAGGAVSRAKAIWRQREGEKAVFLLSAWVMTPERLRGYG